MPEGLGIDVGQRSSGLLLGRWYAARDVAGVYVSVIKPQAIADAALERRTGAA